MSPVACALCRSTDWLPLPDVGGNRTVTTAGHIVAEPLGKSQCGRCALVQRTRRQMLAATDFYRTSYNFYFERPGAARFDRGRYDAMANWIGGAIGDAPADVLDAGCGRGWMIEALRRLWPGTRFSGIEPSESESEHARQQGLDVRTGTVGSDLQTGRLYDLVYSTNVVEHTESPVDFLVGLTNVLAPGGQIILTCPDASEPNQEIMFSDQSFSFLPAHLRVLGGLAGLEMTGWQAAPPQVSVRDKQLVVYRKAGSSTPQIGSHVGEAAKHALYEHRRAYLKAWDACHQWLVQECQDARNVYNFGTSTWSFLLAGYCPDYWSRVTSCTIDGGTGEFVGKSVVDAEALTLTADDAIVLGVDPGSQKQFQNRFDRCPAKVVTWDHMITR